MNLTFALGRALFGGFFLYNGINHFKQVEGLAQYAAAKELPYPELSVQLSGAALIASGASMAFGIKPHLGAAGAALFLAVASGQMHDFWNQQDPGIKQNELVHFSKNMALLAAAIAIGAKLAKSKSNIPSLTA